MEHDQDSDLSWPKRCSTPQSLMVSVEAGGSWPGATPAQGWAGHQSAVGSICTGNYLFPLGFIYLSLAFSLQLVIVVDFIMFSLLTCSYLNPQSPPDSMLLGGTEIMG